MAVGAMLSKVRGREHGRIRAGPLDRSIDLGQNGIRAGFHRDRTRDLQKKARGGQVHEVDHLAVQVIVDSRVALVPFEQLAPGRGQMGIICTMISRLTSNRASARRIGQANLAGLR